MGERFAVARRPLQNRVTPFGEIEALTGRGTMLGNRGTLCDDAQHIVRKWQVRRWIACRLHVPGRRRKLMQPHTWTELFFLDEAAAFAAGHRPCAACLYADYKRFKELWIGCFGGPAGADDMDDRLHADRILKGGMKRTHRAEISELPEGTYIALEGEAWVVIGERLLAWSDNGYTTSQSRFRHREVDVLTPASLVTVMAAGYVPRLHPSAAQ